VGRVMVSRTDNAGSTVSMNRKELKFNKTHQDIKGYDSILTVVRWSWKSSLCKECVKTQLPNRLVLKIDYAKVIGLYLIKFII